MGQKVKMGFERRPVSVPLDRLLKTRALPGHLKETVKYQRIVASIREVGIIEPLVVHPQKAAEGTYLLLDGHLRAEALRDLGLTEAPCLVSTDDEGYSYNRHVSRMSAFQEHFMVINALGEGVSEERLARALNVDVKKVREKRDFLRGICPEAVQLLRHREVGQETIRYFRQVKPLRQVEMAELMIAANHCTKDYARALYLATQKDQLAEPDKPKDGDGVSPEEIARMEREMETLERDFRLVEDEYGRNVLNLVVARNYLARLLDNARVVRFLSQRHPDVLAEFQKIAEATSLEA